MTESPQHHSTSPPDDWMPFRYRVLVALPLMIGLVFALRWLAGSWSELLRKCGILLAAGFGLVILWLVGEHARRILREWREGRRRRCQVS